jgi:hypothetical protein
MKKSFLTASSLCMMLAFSLTSFVVKPLFPANKCKKGTITITNKAFHTIQMISIDSLSYGKIKPQESKTFSLKTGTHTVYLNSINDGVQCNHTSFNIKISKFYNQIINLKDCY